LYQESVPDGLENKHVIAASDGRVNAFVTDPEACQTIEFLPGEQALAVLGSHGQAGGLNSAGRLRPGRFRRVLGQRRDYQYFGALQGNGIVSSVFFFF
jgi:hypothetical protein